MVRNENTLTTEEFIASLGIRRAINAAGPASRLGGTRLPAEVLDAMVAARGLTTSMAELQATAGRFIAGVTGTEAGLVTSGAFAGLALAAAASIARLDLGIMDRLPLLDAPAEFIIAREHRNGYDHAVRLAGGRFVEVGMNERGAGAGVRHTEVREYATAVTPATKGILYVATPTSQPSLQQLSSLTHSLGIPLIVDAANQLPPVSNLRLFAEQGADLIVFSGGKGIRGPQDTGILCGRRDLIMSAAIQYLDMDEHFDIWNPPADFIDKSLLQGLPRHSMGRGFKVAKHDVVGLLRALDLFTNGSYEHHYEECNRVLETLKDALSGRPGLAISIDTPRNGAYPTLRIALDRDICRLGAFEVSSKLKTQATPIHLGERLLWEDILVVNPMDLSEADVLCIADALIAILAEEAG